MTLNFRSVWSGRRLVIDGRFLTQDITGVQRVALELIGALDDLLAAGNYPGLRIEVVYPGRSGLKHSVDGYRHIHFRPFGKTTGHLWGQLELTKAAREAPLLCLANIAPIARLAAGKRTYTVVHDLSYRYFPEAYGKRFRLFYGVATPAALKHSTHVFTVSQSERAAILRNYPELAEQRITAIQNGGLSERTTLARVGSAQIPRDSDSCLYVGSLTKRKNSHRLLRVANELASSESINFRVVGSTGSSFDSIPVSDDLHHRVRLLGQVNSSQDLRMEYERATAFVFPSLYEASPLPPIEAMAYGAPVIASDIPSLRERCGEAALYCDPENEQSIFLTTLQVLRDPALQAELRQRGWIRARQFTWSNQAMAILSTLDGAGW